MVLDQINLNQLRIFEAVFRTQSMTKAARELHLTQSGISQHIKSLEEALGVDLFDRIRQRLVPTAAGRFLYEVCQAKLRDLEEALAEVSRQEGHLTGQVRIGVPAEFGINMVVPLVADYIKKHPQVDVRMSIDLADEMNKQILRGEVDLAIIDDFDLDERVETTPIFDEHLELCCSPRLIDPQLALGRKERKFFEDLDYVAYREDLPVIEKWFAHHYGFRRMKLKIRTTISDVLGVSRFISAGVGVGVLPRHNVEKLKQVGEPLVVFEPSSTPLINQLSMATLRDRSHSPLVQHFKKWISDKLRAEIHSDRG